MASSLTDQLQALTAQHDMKDILHALAEIGFSRPDEPPQDVIGRVSPVEVAKVDKVIKEKKVKKEKFVGPKFALPWTGVPIVGCCSALRANYNTFLQCTNAPANDSEFCKTCQKSVINGAHKIGTVQDRIIHAENFVDAEKSRKPAHYSAYLSKQKDITPQNVIDEAASFNIIISLDDLTPPVKISKKGRPSKQPISYNDELDIAALGISNDDDDNLIADDIIHSPHDDPHDLD